MLSQTKNLGFAQCLLLSSQASEDRACNKKTAMVRKDVRGNYTALLFTNQPDVPCWALNQSHRWGWKRPLEVFLSSPNCLIKIKLRKEVTIFH